MTAFHETPRMSAETEQNAAGAKGFDPGRNTLEDYMAEIDADKPRTPARCDWCVGIIRRDCSIMGRCVQTGMSRPSIGGRKYG